MVLYELPPEVTNAVIVVVTVFVVDATLTLELELLLEPATLRMPPKGADDGGDVEVVAFLAKATKAARVFPVAGALMDATMPF